MLVCLFRLLFLPISSGLCLWLRFFVTNRVVFVFSAYVFGSLLGAISAHSPGLYKGYLKAARALDCVQWALNGRLWHFDSICCVSCFSFGLAVFGPAELLAVYRESVAGRSCAF